MEKKNIIDKHYQHRKWFIILWSHPMVSLGKTAWIGHLTNYEQNAYFWTFWTFSYKGKSRNDTKPVSVGR